MEIGIPLLMIAGGIIALIFIVEVLKKALWPATTPQPEPEFEDAPTDPMLSPIDLGKYMKGRTDIPVDTGGLYQGEDDENAAALVRAAFLTGGMVIGNVNDEGDLEITLYSPEKDC